MTKRITNTAADANSCAAEFIHSDKKEMKYVK